MGLKTKEITIEGDPKTNRDAGKRFLLTEMPALKAERWARHAAAAVNRADLNIRDELRELGMLGFYLLGFQALAGADPAQMDPLMDEMLGQVQIITSKDVIRSLNPDGSDIEEIKTILALRKELLELHMGFTFAELAQILRSSAEQASTDLPNTPTSPISSEA